MEKLTLKVYAKINFKLDILGKLDDGYHSLDMLMSSCDLYDEIIAEKSAQNEVYMDGVLQGNKNTASKALALLSMAYGYKLKVQIKKHIPMCAGVGGSSADAAAVFFAYSRLYAIDLEYMTKLALSVGSDVVYMLKGGWARVRCKGEIISPLEIEDTITMVIAQKVPGAATQDVYKAYDNVGRVVEEEFTILNSHRVFNVLQKPAIALCKEIQETIDDLKKYSNRVFMTGSGSAVCAIFDSESEAKACLNSLDDGYAFKQVVKTLPYGMEILDEQ